MTFFVQKTFLGFNPYAAAVEEKVIVLFDPLQSTLLGKKAIYADMHRHCAQEPRQYIFTT
jgi:hypothetical protein